MSFVRCRNAAYAASLTVDLRGSELTFSPASDAGIRIANASNLTLVGPVIDSAPFFSSQGVVSAGVRDGKWCNYTFAVEAGRSEVLAA